MKNKVFKILSAAALTLVAGGTFAQFSLSGEFRPRTEYRDGFKSLADPANDYALFTDQRTRLNFDYKAKGFRTFIQFQDVRVWGSQSQLTSSDGATTTLHQAYGDAFLRDNLSLRLGRQELVYDDHRIFGHVGWAQQARSHDAAVLKLKADSGALKLDLGIAYNQDGAALVNNFYNVGKSYKTMQYLWAHKDFNKNLGASFLVLNNGKQAADSTVDYTQTLGTFVKYKSGKVFTDFSGYYQMGEDGALSDISAYQFGFNLGYKVTDNISTIVGYEHMSGINETDGSGYAFAPLYGTNHKFNGFMDYFYVGNHGNSVGLQDVVFKLKYKKEKVSAGIDVHAFLSAAEVLDDVEFANSATIQADESYLGTEVDVYYARPLAEGVMLKAGYSQMFGTAAMVSVKNGGDINEVSNWAYLMVIMKPKFFASK